MIHASALFRMRRGEINIRKVSCHKRTPFYRRSLDASAAILRVCSPVLLVWICTLVYSIFCSVLFRFN